MLLVDTSIWIDFLRGKESTQALSGLLSQNQVACHSWIVGELMVGQLGSQRRQILHDIHLLPKLEEYSLMELSDFVERESLYAKGLSFIDIQLLYACLVEDHLLWTNDQKLKLTSHHYKIAFILSA
ncbi:MAG: VapC toxin family PIN domain ribonuclease [Chlamydiae bacterium]|nr:VapC toxin family PIN domain ribonuclease [Chlamydiota bacterium]MBI3265948.1 VapC toxin family PIN domain ribonuclease [Chlamydiota bacterium]